LNKLPKLELVPQECHRTDEIRQKPTNNGQNAALKKVVEIGSKA